MKLQKVFFRFIGKDQFISGFANQLGIGKDDLIGNDRLPQKFHQELENYINYLKKYKKKIETFKQKNR